MKSSFIVSMLLLLIIEHQSLWGQNRVYTAVDSVSDVQHQFVLADIAGFPLSYTHSGSWQPYQSIRVGYGRGLKNMFELRVFAEYTTYDFDNHDGNMYQDYSPGQRHDYAINPTIVALRFIEIGLGGYYTVQDEVYHRSFWSSQVTIDPAVKKFGIYLHYGVSGSFHFAGPVNIAFAMFFRNDLRERNGIFFGCRAGLKYEI